MKTLVLCDDVPHPGEMVRTGLKALGDCGFEFEWIEEVGDWSTERMAGYSLVVFAKANNASAKDRSSWMTDEIAQAFLAYVDAGGGLLAIHGGTAGYGHLPVLCGLLGGMFVKHPPQCPVTVEPRQGHPVTAGCVPFTVQDEHFFVQMHDPQADVFATTRSEHGAQPGGWSRTQGLGRVCVLTPGHNPEVWLCSSFQTLLRNALRWCCAII